MTETYSIHKNQKPTHEQIEEIEKASMQEIVFDDDCPEYSYEELVSMREAALKKRNEREVTLSVSEETVEKAKMYDKNYKGFLSRLLKAAIGDADFIKKAIL